MHLVESHQLTELDLPIWNELFVERPEAEHLVQDGMADSDRTVSPSIVASFRSISCHLPCAVGIAVVSFTLFEPVLFWYSSPLSGSALHLPLLSTDIHVERGKRSSEPEF